jgi:hypothetical protein
VLEKPETLKNDDLCAVRSSKARRLKHIRPGFFNPPGGRPICVPGLHWLGLLILGHSGTPTVAAMQWWTRRGERASDQQTQLEQLLRYSWRYSKSELAMESPRVWTWERREKLLLMVTLVYAFLLSLLDASFEMLRSWLLRCWCHRTGKRSREVAAPLYRLRSALSRLWQAYLSSPGTLRLTSG